MSLINKTSEVRELRTEDLRKFKSAQAVLPLSLQNLQKIGIHESQKVPL
jgi:hypothetical protein